MEEDGIRRFSSDGFRAVRERSTKRERESFGERICKDREGSRERGIHRRVTGIPNDQRANGAPVAETQFVTFPLFEARGNVISRGERWRNTRAQGQLATDRDRLEIAIRPAAEEIAKESRRVSRRATGARGDQQVGSSSTRRSSD